jgi:hypothetical protein
MSGPLHPSARTLALGLCVILGCCALSCTPALAAEGSRPVIGPTLTWNASEEAVVASIDPEGLETTYEFALCAETTTTECRAVSSFETDGQLAAGYESREVTLDLAGLPLTPSPKLFEISARNSAGNVHELRAVFPPELLLPIPVENTTPFEDPQPPGAIEHLEEVGKKQQLEFDAAKEAQERAAAEAAQRAASPAATPTLRCVVPSLTGHTFSGARWLLVQAHCKLGHVSYPRAGRGRLHVAKQSPSRGAHLPAGGAVAIGLVRLS